MFVKVIPTKDMDRFHKDLRVTQIIKLLLSDETDISLEVLRLINLATTEDKLSERIEPLNNGLNPDRQKLLWDYLVPLYNIYKDPHCSNLRGAILEKFVYESLNSKYTHQSILSTSCFVCIDEWKSERTVDLLYYSTDRQFGETFECKISPTNLEEHDFNNLKDIYSRSNKEIIPCIASLVKTTAIELEAGYLKIPLGAIKLFGINNIKELSSF